MNLTPEQERKILNENPRKFLRFGTLEDMLEKKHLVRDPEFTEEEDGDFYISINYAIKLLKEAKEAGAKYFGAWVLDDIDLYLEEQESEYRARINVIKAEMGAKYQEDAKILDLNFPRWKQNRFIDLKNQIEALQLSEEAWEVLKGE